MKIFSVWSMSRLFLPGAGANPSKSKAESAPGPRPLKGTANWQYTTIYCCMENVVFAFLIIFLNFKVTDHYSFIVNFVVSIDVYSIQLLITRIYMK